MHTRNTATASGLIALSALAALYLPKLSTPTLPAQTPTADTTDTVKPEHMEGASPTTVPQERIAVELQTEKPSSLEAEIKWVRLLLKIQTREGYDQAFEQILSRLNQMNPNDAAIFQSQIGQPLCEAAHHNIRLALQRGEAFAALNLLEELAGIGAMNWWTTDAQLLADFNKLRLSVEKQCGIDGKDASNSAAFLEGVKSAGGQDFQSKFGWQDLLSQANPSPQVNHSEILLALDSDSLSEVRKGQRRIQDAAAYYHSISASDPTTALAGTLGLLRIAHDFELDISNGLNAQAKQLLVNVLAGAGPEMRAIRAQRILAQLQTLHLEQAPELVAALNE